MQVMPMSPMTVASLAHHSLPLAALGTSFFLP